MTPAELDEYLKVARVNGCTRLKLGDLEADLGTAPVAAVPAQDAAPVSGQAPVTMDALPIMDASTAEQATAQIMDKAEAMLFGHEKGWAG